MKKEIVYSLSGLLALSACGSQVHEKKTEVEQTPNIIVILVDDMGYSDIGCFGSEINTPNLDKLAEEGVRMTQFYNCARSCPSRAALLTGLYPHQSGIGHMSYDDNLPAYRGFLNNNCVTIAEVLQQSGYSTFISGKWHVGHKKEHWPTQRGFEKQYGSYSTTGHYFGLEKTKQFIVEGKDSMPDGQWINSNLVDYKLMKNEDGSQWYATDAYTDRAMQYINEQKQNNPDKPFFLYLAYTAPHWPLQAFEKDIAKYRGKYLNGGWDNLRIKRYKKMLDLGIIDSNWLLTQRNQEVESWQDIVSKISEDEWERIGAETLGGADQFWDYWMAVYAAMIDNLDQNIGRLMQCLKDNQYDENTIIIFMSDNGACHETARKGDPTAIPGSAHSFAGYAKPWANAGNTPFNWFKRYTHEGGISSPFIAWYPKKIKGGQINHQMAHITDIMPTCIDLANAKYPKKHKNNQITPLVGQSLLPIFMGKEVNLRDTLYWEHMGNLAMRAGKWKIVSRADYKTKISGEWELYDMETDRTETNNLANKYPDKVKELEKHFNKWANEVGVVEFSYIIQRRADKKMEKSQQ